MLKQIDGIQNKIIPCPELVGAPLISKTQDSVPPTISKAECLTDQYKSLNKNTTIIMEGDFPGLIPLINSYLSGMDVDADTHCTVQQYLKLIQRRASGDLMTTAQWLRK
ncbi:hypothetical protein J437_LFUL019657, partial [Ladona fulva]